MDEKEIDRIRVIAEELLTERLEGALNGAYETFKMANPDEANGFFTVAVLSVLSETLYEVAYTKVKPLHDTDVHEMVEMLQGLVKAAVLAAHEGRKKARKE